MLRTKLIPMNFSNEIEINVIASHNRKKFKQIQNFTKAQIHHSNEEKRTILRNKAEKRNYFTKLSQIYNSYAKFQLKIFLLKY